MRLPARIEISAEDRDEEMISVRLDGVKDAVETVKDLIVPWRRKNAERKANLDNAYRQAEIQRINAENLIAQAQAKKTEAEAEAVLTLAQAERAKAEAEKAKAEAERELVEIRQSQMELAIKIVDRYAQNASGELKMLFVKELLQIIDRVASDTINIIT